MIGRSLMELPDQVGPGHADVVKDHLALLVLRQRDEGDLGEAGALGVHQEEREARVAPGSGRRAARDQALVGRHEVVHEQLPPVEDEVVPIGDRLRPDRLGEEARVLLRERPRQHPLAPGDGRQHRFALRLGPVPGNGHRGHHRAVERKGNQRASRLLQDQAQVHQGEVLSAVLLGQGHPLPAELGGLPPQRGRIPLGVGLHLAHEGRRTFRVEELPRGVAQHLLFFGQQ